MNKTFESGFKEIALDELIGPLNNVERRFSPKTLFLKGNCKIIGDYPLVSIIGTRNPTENGINNTIKLTRFLVKNEVAIVSGLAKGIDTIAHKTAINNGGYTIAVLGTPLDQYYPKENRSLQDEIARDHLLISQFPFGSHIERKNFPIRNRTMALLSHASVIIEAGENSGTMHQGWEALRLGRPLFLIEDMIKNQNLTWPNKLVEYGAEILPISKIRAIFESLPIPVKVMENHAIF